MATIGQQTMKDPREMRQDRPREQKRRDRIDAAKGVGCVVGSIAAVLGALFAVVYLVTLAVRLGWGE